MHEQIRAFSRRLEEATAERRVPFVHGTGLFCDSTPNVYDANYIRVESPTSAIEHAAEADRLMEPFWHRRIATDHTDDALSGELEALGWSTSTHLVMAHVRPPDRVVDTGHVREVPLQALLEPHTRVTLAESYGTPELADQLFATKRRIGQAVRTRYFAVDIGGEIAAYCELRGDAETAQIEDVNTLAAHRGRGLGRAVVQHALGVAQAEGALVFIEALADDWPKELYSKLGFELVGERRFFLRPPHPLARLRVRTPRLELRLATVSELRALERVAEAGIHDPRFMPFGIAWTDAFDEESFLDWHLSALRDWRPEHWRLELVCFVDGDPVGSQALHAIDYGSTCRASTGSWLGSAWQGQGLGTEMRTAILTLAFTGLRANEAASGAIVGNHASLAVSRKLGYREAGRSIVSPRGTPVEHHNLVLARGDWKVPSVAVSVEGLSGLESLFGLEVDEEGRLA